MKYRIPIIQNNKYKSTVNLSDGNNTKQKVYDFESNMKLTELPLFFNYNHKNTRNAIIRDYFTNKRESTLSIERA